MNTEQIYGTRPGDTEDRVVNGARFYSLDNRRFLGPELQDPLTKQFELLFKELSDSFTRENDPFYRNQEVTRKISSLAWNLGLREPDKKDRLPLLISSLDYFRNELSIIIDLMEDAGKRARYEGRKNSIKRIVSRLRSRMETIMDSYETMSSLHVLLQSHFIAQRCGIPHHKEIHDEKLTIFYEPLYRYRDKYFEDPSSVNLSNYLKCWEHLIREPYYQQLLTKKDGKQEKLQKRAAEVQELADELEIYALMEMA